MSELGRAIGERIRQTRGDMSQAEFASKIGVNKTLLGKYERGESIPGGEFLSQLRDILGISLDWLLTGWTQPPNLDDDDKYMAAIEVARTQALDDFKATARAAPQQRDPDLYGRVLEAISAVYKEMGWAVTLRQLGAEAAQIADEIAAEGLAPEDKPPAVKAAAAMLRRQLRIAAANPTTSQAAKDQA